MPIPDISKRGFRREIREIRVWSGDEMAIEAIVVLADSIPLGWFDPVVQGSDNYLRVQAHPRTPRPVNDPNEWARNHADHGIPVRVSSAEHVDFFRQELGIDVSALEGDLPRPLDKDQHVLVYSPEIKAWWTL